MTNTPNDEPSELDVESQFSSEAAVPVELARAVAGPRAAGVAPQAPDFSAMAIKLIRTADQLHAAYGHLPSNEWPGPPKILVSDLREVAAALAAQPPAADQPRLTVWYGKMPESCGRTNWTAILYSANKSKSYTIARSEYPHRVRYEADRVRALIGEIPESPFILDYDADERTPCHLCNGTGEKDGKPCHGLNFDGTVHHETGRRGAEAP
ncbi:hypothetical protein D9M73_68850 [compost metagenome]